MNHTLFPSLEGLDQTRKTLHAYSKVIGMVPRALAEPHPMWWHVAFTVVPNGLISRNIVLPDGGLFHMRLDIRRGEAVLVTAEGVQWTRELTRGESPNQLAEKLFARVAEYGLEGEYDPEKYASDEPLQLDLPLAKRYWRAVVNVETVLRKRWNHTKGNLGPLQIWPHGFDMAFEWFGTRTVEYEEAGEITSYPSQLNFGWSPGEPSHPAPYFYSNPWPFEASQLTGHELPHGARWVDSSWQGSLLEYNPLVGDPQGEQKVLDFAGRVFDLAAPTLTSGGGK